MKNLLFLMSVVFLASACIRSERNFTPNKPEFSQIKNHKELMKIRKLRVGFIDLGSPQWDADELWKYKSLSQRLQSKSFDNDHGAFTVRKFTQELEKNIPNAWKYVEVVYCEVENKTSKFVECLEFLKKSNIDFLNISWAVEDLLDREVSLLKELSTQGVVITVPAGNTPDEVTSSSLCGIAIPNKICVGGTSGGHFVKSFAYGSRINAYAEVQAVLPLRGEMMTMTGTSLSSPLFLGLFVSHRAMDDYNEFINFNALYKQLGEDNGWKINLTKEKAPQVLAVDYKKEILFTYNENLMAGLAFRETSAIDENSISYIMYKNNHSEISSLLPIILAF